MLGELSFGGKRGAIAAQTAWMTFPITPCSRKLPCAIGADAYVALRQARTRSAPSLLLQVCKPYPAGLPDTVTVSADDDLLQLCNSPIATVVTDPRAPDNPIVAVNQAFVLLTGYAAADSIGRNCRFLARASTGQAGTAILREAVEKQRPALTELLNYRQDGTPFRNAVMIAPLYDAEGSIKYFIGSQMEVPDTAMSGMRRQVSRELVDRLTPRQREVLRDMTLGYRNKQIAARLGLSEKTVKMHRSSMLGRLGAISSTEAVRIGVEAGI